MCFLKKPRSEIIKTSHRTNPDPPRPPEPRVGVVTTDNVSRPNPPKIPEPETIPVPYKTIVEHDQKVINGLFYDTEKADEIASPHCEEYHSKDHLPEGYYHNHKTGEYVFKEGCYYDLWVTENGRWFWVYADERRDDEQKAFITKYHIGEEVDKEKALNFVKNVPVKYSIFVQDLEEA